MLGMITEPTIASDTNNGRLGVTQRAFWERHTIPREWLSRGLPPAFQPHPLDFWDEAFPGDRDFHDRLSRFGMP